MPLQSHFLSFFFFAILVTLLLMLQQKQLEGYATGYTRGMTIKNNDTYPSLVEEKPVKLIIKDTKPPISEVIDDEGNILQDIDFLMDFAVIGHPKTATSSTLKWLGAHHEVQMHPHELHTLQMGNVPSHVKQFYNFLPGDHIKRGYKNPGDISNPKAMKALAQYFPSTKLMIGLRHPVLWFQSFYNFRVRKGNKMPPPQQLLGQCAKDSKFVCTDHARFHLHLSRFEKTPLSPEEKHLLDTPRHLKWRVGKMKNPVFLYEIGQLKDDNATRVEQYKSDLQHYLGLQSPLPEVYGKEISSRPKENVFDICDSQYDELRMELMKHAQAASTWIRDFFLESPDVTVSSPEYFRELLLTWMYDPCVSSNS